MPKEDRIDKHIQTRYDEAMFAKGGKGRMKTALITGGSRGIGAQLVRDFSAAGYRTLFLYRQDQEAARQVQAETGAQPIRCDVRCSDQVQGAVEAVGHIDVLVNNAAIAQQKLFTDITDEDWRAMLDTALSGAFYASRAALPDMIRRRWGRIINISSIWGQVGASCEVHYSAAKAGLIGLTRALAKEVAPSGITVNCLCPGVIATDMLSTFSPEDLEALRQETPVGRLGTPVDVSAAALWLAQEQSAFVTGQIIGINGGFGE